MPSPKLAELQEAFFRSIAAHPGSGPATYDPTVLSVIAPSRSLSPEQRLDVYAGMYLARLRDCLREDFERTYRYLGTQVWDSLVTAYLTESPSRHPSVRYVGSGFASFLAARSDVRPELAELARFEWSRLGVFDAPDAEPLAGSTLAAVAPEDWGALRFAVVPALDLFRSEWPVHRLWAEDGPPSVDPQPTSLRVWRQNHMIYHATMASAEENALRRLMSGASFADVCDAASVGLVPEEAAPKAVALLARWIEDGLLLSWQ